MKYWFTLLLALPSIVFGQVTQTALVADGWVDVEEGQYVAGPVALVIEGERIVQLSTPNVLDAEIAKIDLPGMTLVPGMIDMHTHMTGSPDFHGYSRLSRSQMRSLLGGVQHASDTLLAGVTTVRNVGAGGFADVALRDAINDGDIVGPRMFVSGPSLGITGGHCDSNLLPPEYESKGQGVADGPWAAVQKVRENIKYGADVIKICATGGVLSKGTKVGVQQYSLAEMQALVEEAHRRGLTVAAHAHGTEGINDAIRAGVDSIEHASFIDDEGIRMARKQGTFLSMDIYVTEFILGEGEAAGILPESLEKERQVGSVQRENFRKAHEAGVKMVMGTDAGVYPHGQNLRQLSRMVQFGMQPIEALQAASINAATLLKQQDNLGSIKVGKFADIIAVPGNPLEDIRLMEAVGFVMKGGVVFREIE